MKKFTHYAVIGNVYVLTSDVLDGEFSQAVLQSGSTVRILSDSVRRDFNIDTLYKDYLLLNKDSLVEVEIISAVSNAPEEFEYLFDEGEVWTVLASDLQDTKISKSVYIVQTDDPLVTLIPLSNSSSGEVVNWGSKVMVSNRRFANSGYEDTYIITKGNANRTLIPVTFDGDVFWLVLADKLSGFTELSAL